jgi:hypothetical protein
MYAAAALYVDTEDHMSNESLVREPQAPTSATPAVDAARTRLLTGSDYLSSFPLGTSVTRRDRSAPLNRDSRAALHALRGAVPK